MNTKHKYIFLRSPDGGKAKFTMTLDSPVSDDLLDKMVEIYQPDMVEHRYPNGKVSIEHYSKEG